VKVLPVCGLKREMRLVPGAVTPNGIAAVADVAGIISIGIAGALAPGLEVGDTVIAERVVTANEAFETDAKWTARLAAALRDAHIGTILGRDAIADSVEVKALLHEASRADAVDMESHLAARAAKARGVPFAALRVISDGADQALPPAALVAMRPDGSIALGRVLASVLRQPSQIPALIRTGRESEAAFQALARNLAVLGPGLRLP
jgi:hopanoid-associated phosphorylase